MSQCHIPLCLEDQTENGVFCEEHKTKAENNNDKTVQDAVDEVFSL